MHEQHHRTAFAPVALLALSSMLGAQTVPFLTPDLEVPPRESRPVLGGEVYALEAWKHWNDPGDDQEWVLSGEDGGRIRLSKDAGATWHYAETPEDFTGTVLDFLVADTRVDEHPDYRAFETCVAGDCTSDAVVYACGRNGRVLKSENGGASWAAMGPIIENDCGQPATLFGLEMLEGTLFVIGDGVFVAQSGSTWTNVVVYESAPDTTTGFAGIASIPNQQIQGTSLGAMRSSLSAAKQDIGLASVGFFRGNEEFRAGALYTDTRRVHTNAGANWWLSFDEAGPNGTGPIRLQKAYEVVVERGAIQDLDPQLFLVGGALDNGGDNSRYYVPDPLGVTGLDWVLGNTFSAAIYSGTAIPAARGEPSQAMLASYDGSYLRFESGLFIDALKHETTALPTTEPVTNPQATDFTPPLWAVASLEAETYYLGGRFGMARKTTSFGVPVGSGGPLDAWSSLHTYHVLDEQEWRGVTGLHALDDDSLWISARNLGVGLSNDGGLTWERAVECVLDEDDLCDGMAHVIFTDALSAFDSFGRNGVAVGCDGISLVSSDSGKTWQDSMLYVLNGDSPPAYEPVPVPSSFQLSDVSIVDIPFGLTRTIAVGWDTSTPGQHTPLLLGSSDLGANWRELFVSYGGASVAPTDHVRLVACDFASIPSESGPFAEFVRGVVVGYTQEGLDNDPGETRALAYKVDAGTAGPIAILFDRSPMDPVGNPGHGRKLLDVDLTPIDVGLGGNLSMSRAFAVGNDGLVLEWYDPSPGAGGPPPTFREILPTFDCEDELGNPSTCELAVDHSAVAMSPSGDVVLIGSQYDVDLQSAGDKGYLLRGEWGEWAGPGQWSWDWQRQRASVGKDVLDIALTSDSSGFLIASSQTNHPADPVGVPKVCSTELFDGDAPGAGDFVDAFSSNQSHPSGNNGMVLRYDATEP